MSHEARAKNNGSQPAIEKSIDATEEATDDCAMIDSIIGNFGKYQFLIFMFKVLIGATSAFYNLGVTFYAPSDFISYWCADNTTALTTQELALQATTSLTTTEAPSATHVVVQAADQQSRSAESAWQILTDFVHNDERTLRHESVYANSDTPKSLRKECDYLSPVDGTRHKCNSFQYDTSIWMSTVIEEWNLVCDRAVFISMTQSLYMAGFIVTLFVFGYLSDRFGRWNTLLLGALIEIGAGFGCAFAGSALQFMIFRVLLGIGNAGRSSSSYLIMIEWTGKAYRMHVSVLGSLGWVLCYCAMPWISMYYMHFRHVQLFVCFYESIFLVCFLFLPESPRWLLTHRRYDEARAALLRAAKFNGLLRVVTPPTPPQQQQQLANNDSSFHRSTGASDHGSTGGSSGGHEPRACLSKTCTGVVQPYTLDEFEIKFALLVETFARKEFTGNEDKLSIFDLFKWPNLRKYTLILSFGWALNAFIYYGIALNVGKFGARNLFVSFTIAGATEVPSIIFTIICMKMLPRKATNIFLFSVVALLCALQVPIKYYEVNWLQQSTMILAKLFNSCSFTVILYQTMELFPTSIRQTAYSTCCLAGRIGSILAPFIKELSQMTNNLVPPVIYAVLSLMELVLIRDLPETQGSDLPDTLLEAEKFKGTDAKKKRQPPA